MRRAKEGWKEEEKIFEKWMAVRYSCSVSKENNHSKVYMNLPK